MSQPQQKQKQRRKEIDSVVEARPWLLKAFGEYIKAAKGGSITIDHRKLSTWIERHPGSFPILIGQGDGRIPGMVVDEMADVGLIHLMKRVRSNGGCLYIVSRCPPLKPIGGSEMIPLDLLDQPELLVRPIGNVVSLMASIAEVGLQYPILLRRKTGGRYIVVDGCRRVEACRCLGTITEIPAIVLREQISDQLAFELGGVSNLERATMTPLEEARYFDTILKNKWRTKSELAKRFAMKIDTLDSRLRLLDLPPEMQSGYEGGLIRGALANDSALYIKGGNGHDKSKRQEQVAQLTGLAIGKEVAVSDAMQALKILANAPDLTTSKAVELARQVGNERARNAAEGKIVILNRESGKTFSCNCGCQYAIDWQNGLLYRTSSPGAAAGPTF